MASNSGPSCAIAGMNFGISGRVQLSTVKASPVPNAHTSKASWKWALSRRHLVAPKARCTLVSWALAMARATNRLAKLVHVNSNSRHAEP